LLVQGLTTKPLLDGLNLLEDRQNHAEYLELLAQRGALARVLSYIKNSDGQSALNPENYQHDLDAVQSKLQQIDEMLTTLQATNPQIEALIHQQHQAKLLEIESAAYTTFVQQGWLKQAPPPIVPQTLMIAEATPET
jgi:CPA1 family monovalent cation:H+ antiporter